ncbi:guanine nucleotide-binding protein-like 3 isoform X2 [Coturnix japonica]|uniref:guanine nucleotide-binding protein-like 3 isoform X2 n=1 Tax=Coturnix japonica TaxID=93934 RepID=UPI00077767B8|nr:guanine nucleotide-binding protein-like 3 isoform X2 [Coturnix japonica]
MKRPKLRKASKRLTCHKRYKIQKKIREHHRKVRKEAKKRGRKKNRKDPGVPGTAPFKEELLREAELRKQRLEELKQKQKLERQKELERRRKLDAKRSTAAAQEQTEGKEASGKSEAKKTKKDLDKNAKKSFHSELEKVIEMSDVLLEVLDARDPMGCRCPQLEQAVAGSGGEKKLLLVLNKIDLVPKENLQKWLNYLKKEFPTVAFKSATLLKDRNMTFSRRRARIDLSRHTESFGSTCLVKLLQEYGRTQNKAIQVGLVGFPNVGKSSVINSIKKDRVCDVGPARGVTKSMQVVRIDKQLKILDSPSIVADRTNSAVTMALRSIIHGGELCSVNLVKAVDAILDHCNKQQVMMFYSIPDFRNTEEFLSLLAQKRGMLKKGGVPDIENMAKSLLCDWTGAKISYHSEPPPSQILPPYLTEDKIAEMQVGFNLKKLEEENSSTVQALKYPSPASSIVFQAVGMTNGKIVKDKVEEEESEWEDLEISHEEEDLMETDDDQDTMEEEEEENNIKEDGRTPMTRNAELGMGQTESEIAESRVANSLSFSSDKAAGEDDAYDFNTDYV